MTKTKLALQALRIVSFTTTESEMIRGGAEETEETSSFEATHVPTCSNPCLP